MKIFIMVQIIVLSGFLSEDNYIQNKEPDIRMTYQKCGLPDVLTFNIFEFALSGLQRMSEVQNKKTITIIDFTKPSTQERFFVIDLENNKVLYKTLVAHGRNSGENIAKSFSNTSLSLKSCLGFFITGDTYIGKHGYSLSLDGLEPGINNNARKRAIVIHGADYVSTDFAKKYGRIGRSWGCPALPVSISKEIIDRIKNGSCIFIYGDDPAYFKTSKIINKK